MLTQLVLSTELLSVLRDLEPPINNLISSSTSNFFSIKGALAPSSLVIFLNSEITGKLSQTQEDV